MRGYPVIVVSLVLSIVLVTCQKRQPAVASEKQTEIQKTDFIPPADSAISIDQLKKWIACNSYLDSLSVIYKDSFSTTDATRQTKTQEDFTKAQDRICVRVGLIGGYAEYLWILHHAGSPANAKTLDSLKLTIYK